MTPTTLVTGFPSFLAQRLIVALNGSGTDRLAFLVQEKFLADAERLRAALPSPKLATIVAGDVTKIDFGLSGLDLAALVHDLREFFHFASNGNFGETRARLFEVNVTGTTHALDVAREAHSLSRFVHLSSAFVAGRRIGRVVETDLDGSSGFFNAVEESRFRAEQKVRAAAAQVPVTIVRPGFVVGDSTTGEIDRMSGPYLLLRAIVRPPFDLPVFMAGAGDAPLQLVPVDYVVRAIPAISRRPESVGKTYHLIDPGALPAKRVGELVAAHAHKRPPALRVPLALARIVSRLPGLGRILGEPRAVLDYCNAKTIFDSREADAILASCGIACPPFDTYVGRLVDYIAAQLEPKHSLLDEVRDPLL